MAGTPHRKDNSSIVFGYKRPPRIALAAFIVAVLADGIGGILLSTSCVCVGDSVNTGAPSAWMAPD